MKDTNQKPWESATQEEIADRGWATRMYKELLDLSAIYGDLTVEFESFLMRNGYGAEDKTERQEDGTREMVGEDVISQIRNWAVRSCNFSRNRNLAHAVERSTYREPRKMAFIRN